MRDDPALPLRPAELETLRAVMAANPTVFPLVESAAKKPGVDWGLVFKTPVINTMLPDLQPQRELGVLLKADALLAHTDGDHARVAQRAREVMFQSRAVGRQPILVSHLVSIGLGAMAADLTQHTAEDLRIGTGAGEAPPQRVRELIAMLLDDTLPAESQRHALLGERMMQYDMSRAIAAGNVAPNAVMGAPPPPGRLTLLGRLIKPTVLDDGVLMTRHTTALMDAAQAAPNWPAFKTTAPQRPAEVAEKSWKHLIAAILMPSLDRAVQTHFRSQFDRRTAAVFLAMRMYAVDHGGALPDSLDALVPNYLPSIPNDPFAPTTQPLKYAGGGSDGAGPIVYSVGENGTDDGGSEQEPTTAPAGLPSRPLRPSQGKWEKLDIVTHYKRQPRPEPVVEPEDVLLDGMDVDAATTAPAMEPSPLVP
jgi:hypothetical protein